MLGSNSINELEQFFVSKRQQIMKLIDAETQSSRVTDFYVKGFLQMLIDKIHAIAPELQRKQNQPNSIR
jgi:hypothetical protein